jgi:hypothetical protein
MMDKSGEVDKPAEELEHGAARELMVTGDGIVCMVS